MKCTTSVGSFLQVDVNVDVDVDVVLLFTSFNFASVFFNSSIHFSMTYSFPTNADFDNWVKSSKPSTVKAYIDWLKEYDSYCKAEGVDIHDSESVKSFLVFRHNTPKIAKRSNRRQKIKEGDAIPQKTGELYTILSAIKTYFSLFNLRDPVVSHPTIGNLLASWVKDDPPVQKSPVFEGDEIEEFCAYADNTSYNLFCKAVVLMYVACAGRIGELHDILWEDIRQVEYEGKQLWMFSYFKEKQDGRPEKVESMLGDEISNIVFSLYTGENETFCLMVFSK